MFVFACRTDRGIYFQEARLHRDPSGPRNYSAYESSRKMEGDESRLTFESPNLFGGREKKCWKMDEGKEDETRFRVSQKGSHGTRNTIIDGDWLFQPGVSLSNTRDS